MDNLDITKTTLFVASHSGGKDSQAMLIKLAQVVPVEQIIVVHACLGDVEWPGARELAQANADALGVPFIVATATKSLLGMVESRFEKRPEVPSWPSSATRQCTSDLKRGPIEREVRRYAKAHGYDQVVNCMGFRAEESPARAKRPTFTRVARNCTQTREWFDWLPIHDLTTGEVFQAIADDGQQPHAAYSQGNDRLSCVFCIMASRNDIRNGAKANPALLERYIALEEKTGYTMHMSRIPLKELAA